MAQHFAQAQPTTDNPRRTGIGVEIMAEITKTPMELVREITIKERDAEWLAVIDSWVEELKKDGTVPMLEENGSTTDTGVFYHEDKIELLEELKTRMAAKSEG